MKDNIFELPYCENPSVYFRYFAHLPHAILLDSGRPYRQDNRFDIISAYPRQLIHDDALNKIKKALKALKETDPHFNTLTDLPFFYGAIGYFSYDLGVALLNLKPHAEQDVQLPKCVMGIYDWSIVTDHTEKKTLFLRHPLSAITFEKIQATLTQAIFKPSSFYLTSAFQSNMTFDTYAQAFNKIQYHLRWGDCYQVNLCQRLSATWEGSPWSAYELLRQNNPAPFGSFIKLPKGAILSLSPERFLKLNDHSIETKPIKGTRARHADSQLDEDAASELALSEKDRAENLMIVDLLRNDLGRCCLPGSIEVPSLFAIESFPHVHHLVSTIQGQLKPELDAVDLLKATFPGGSITGAPKISAMKIINEVEPHHRSVFCGSIGYINAKGDMDMNIAIRTLICDRNNLHCYAGGGIVADSTLKDEYQESLIKINKMIGLLERQLTNPLGEKL